MAVLRDDGAVLMCHRHPAREWVPNVWDFPGGHVEEHETHQDALARELVEELGIHINPPPSVPDEVLTIEAHSVRLSIWFIDYRGPIENRCPDEHDDVRWLSLEDAAQLDLADPEYIPLIQRALRP
jgi:8-oxo-dGTP pyrophosphatase MutT (NUDIX family)